MPDSQDRACVFNGAVVIVLSKVLPLGDEKPVCRSNHISGSGSGANEAGSGCTPAVMPKAFTLQDPVFMRVILASV